MRSLWWVKRARVVGWDTRNNIDTIQDACSTASLENPSYACWKVDHKGGFLDLSEQRTVGDISSSEDRM